MKNLRWELTSVPDQFQDAIASAYYLKDENNLHYAMIWQPKGTERCGSVHRVKDLPVPINMKHSSFTAADEYIRSQMSQRPVLPLAGPDTKWGTMQ